MVFRRRFLSDGLGLSQRLGLRIFRSLLAVSFAAGLTTSVVGQPPFIWDGGDGSSTDILTAANWSTDAAPDLAGNPAVAADEIHFGPANFTTVSYGAQLFIDKMIFDAGAPAYNFTQSLTPGQDYAFNGPNRLLVNNSSTLQPIATRFNIASTTVQTPGAGFTFSGEYVYANAIAKFNLTNDVTINTVQLQSGARHVYGANGQSTIITDLTGKLILPVASGTGSTNGTNFTGVVEIWSGAVRVGHGDALGRRTTGTGNRTFIHGTFAAATADAQAVGGFDHGFGRLEIYNGITLQENLRIDGRQGDVADFDHVVNISGDNTISPLNLAVGGAGHWNFSSTSGKLTLSGNMSSSDPNKATGGVPANSVWTFRGAGNIDYTGSLQADAFAGVVTALRKQGAGTLTLSGTANTWEGGTLVEGGSLVVASGGTFSASGARIHVADTATLNLAAISGLTVGANVTLSGDGFVVGNVTTNSASAKINPGGIGSLDGSDAIAVTAAAGLLTLQDDLDMSAGGTFEWNLAALSTSNPGDDFDQLSVDGNLALGGSSELALDFSLLGPNDPDSADLFWDTGHTWKIIDTGTNTDSTNFTSISNNSWSSGVFSTLLDEGDVMLVFTPIAIPEGHGYMLPLIGLAGTVLATQIRRRSRRPISDCSTDDR